MDNQTLWKKILKEETDLEGRVHWEPSKKHRDAPAAPCHITGFVPDVFPGGVRKGSTPNVVLHGTNVGDETLAVLQPKAAAFALGIVNLDATLPEARRWFWLQALDIIPRNCLWRPLNPSEDELFLLRELGRPGQEEDPRTGELREKIVFPGELAALLRQDEIRRHEEHMARLEQEEAERREREAQVDEAREVLQQQGVEQVWDMDFMSEKSRLEQEVLWEAYFLLEEGTEESILKARALWH